MAGRVGSIRESDRRPVSDGEMLVTEVRTNHGVAASAGVGAILPLCLYGLVWLPAMFAAAPVWRHGEYYDYGWFVPPAAAYLAWSRWKSTPGPVRPLSTRWLFVGLAILLPWWLGLRVLGHVDPSWRLPMLLLAGTALVTGHGLLAAAWGARNSLSFGWISVFLVSAIPWPSVIENGVVQWLTDQVVEMVAEWFRLFGRPVEVLGDQLRLHDVTVEVTDGCSGMRSFQSFFMATWFFAELQRLRFHRVCILLVGAFGAAFVINMVRTHLLASIRFDHGPDAFEQAHDLLGLLAFLVAAVFFYVFSGWLSGEKRVTVRRRQSSPS